MIVSLTKIELRNYAKLPAFFKFNGQIIQDLKQSNCVQFKVTGNWNLKVWYTMTLWQSEKDVLDFYRNGTHLEAMKQASFFSEKMHTTRVESDQLISWKAAKKTLQATENQPKINGK
jgi:hypothetical protein